MDTLVSEYYVIDSKAKYSRNIDFRFKAAGYLLYEVLRTQEGKLIFLEDHLDRLKNALDKLGLHNLFDEKVAEGNIRKLVAINQNQQGNIKFLCKSLGSKLKYASYYIPHHYPERKDYTDGIELATFVIERNNPGIKQIKINNFVSRKLKNLAHKSSAYDILLINNKGNITEGSRSNFFLVKGNVIFSAPEDFILPGVTRKYVLKIAEENSIKVEEIDIKLEEVDQFEAAFLSGTSPKILPVNKINDHYFSPNHQVLNRIIESFDKIFDSYLEEDNL